jgi:hypothetical protein
VQPPPRSSSTPPPHLADSIGGRTPAESKPASTTPTSTTSAPQPTATEKRLAELSDPRNESGIFSKDPATQKQAMAELRRLHAASLSEDERMAIVNATTPELRDRFGLDEKLDPLPSFLKDSWDSAAERDYLAMFADQGVAPEAVQEIVGWYQKQFTDALGNHQRTEAQKMEDDFRAMAGRLKLPSELVDALVAHERKRLGLT